MSNSIVISIDAMGGDHGPAVAAPGVALAIEQLGSRAPRFLLHGDAARINAELARLPTAAAACEVRHTDKAIGSDEKAAHALLKSAVALPLDYKGFVEGDQIGQGAVDVVVVEGFAGNIALKTAEGTARQIGAYLKAAMASSLMSKLGALFAQGGFRVLKQKMDPRRVNGGTFLGLNGIAVKSHGGTDAFGFASAVDLAYEMADSGLIARLTADIDGFHHRLSAASGGIPPERSAGSALGKV